MTTGERIKALRLSKGMSQEELGAAVGVKKAAINKYENGIVVNLKRSTIAKLADALETTPSYLMGWADEIVRDISGLFNEEKPTPVSESGPISKDRKYLMDSIQNMSDENVHKLRVIVEQVIDERGQ